ncbi:MAG: GntR family transcriptional regulator [Actinomycetales bacterium]
MSIEAEWGVDLDPARSRASLADRAYLALRDRLIMLDIAPGEPIHDDEVAASLGMGRTPVREALKRLEGDRLVECYPRRGTFASGLDLADLTDICEIRIHLEPVAARRAATNAHRTTRDELTALARQVMRESEAADPSRFIHADLATSRAIYRAAGNRHLEDTLVRYANLTTRIACQFADRLSARDLSIPSLPSLLHSIASGDADAAAQLALARVRRFERAVSDAI